jgi:flavin reductase (DIM6/NTAB) family NADH-FMN oxidoreductase RutF
MYYEPGITPHGLPHDPFKSCVVPRPIGWISTLDRDGRANLAPYSQFQNVTFNPPIVMFSANQTTDGRRKDSVRNAEDTGEFVWNLATYALRECRPAPTSSSSPVWASCPHARCARRGWPARRSSSSAST